MAKLEKFMEAKAAYQAKHRFCDNCGCDGASLISEGYVRPYSDVAPTYSEWEEVWLCSDCVEDSKWRKDLEKRSMSSWTKEEMSRYNDLTGQSND